MTIARRNFVLGSLAATLPDPTSEDVKTSYGALKALGEKEAKVLAAWKARGG